MKKYVTLFIIILAVIALYKVLIGSSGQNLFGLITKTQGNIRDMIVMKAALYREMGGYAQIGVIMLFSFLYGAVHAAGPGHNKAAVSAYAVSGGISGVNAAAIGALSGLFHGVMSIALVFVLYYLTKMRLSFAIEHYGSTVAAVGSAGLVIFGLYLFLSTFRQRSQKTERNMLFPVIAGMIPCPATFTVCVFFLSMNKPVLALTSSMALTAGMMVTTALAAFAAGYAGEGALSAFAGRRLLISRISALSLSFMGFLLYFLY